MKSKVFSIILFCSLAGTALSGCSVNLLNEAEKNYNQPCILVDENLSPKIGDDDGKVLEGSKFEVHYIDVGQADSELIICNNATILIDGGNVEDGDVIVTYLQEHDINHLDYVVCTHAHEDHVGGLSAAIEAMDVDVVYAPKTSANTKAYKDFVNSVNEKGIDITHPEPGSEVQLSDAKLIFLGPVTEDYEDINNTSVVIKAEYGDTSFLFTGDAEREAEQDILAAGYDLKADVLKVGHHGSNSSTTYPFLREVMPELAIIEVGKDNKYGHPAENTVSRLRDAEVETYRTDIFGTIIVTSDGKSVLVRAMEK